MNEQFLPSFIPYYPSNEYLTSSAFNSVLTSKQEFRDLELEKAESYPSKKGDRMRHQELIARYMSSHTLYDEMLVLHEMGTGKTCSAIAVMEQLKKERMG